MKLAFLGVALMPCWALAQTPHKASVNASISQLGDTTHLEFRGLKSWQYEVQHPGARQIRLSVPAVDDKSLAQIQAYSDRMISGVEVDRQGPDNTHILTFTLARPDVEAFDYLTDDPSTLILDFYHKAEPEAKKTQATDGPGQPSVRVRKKTATHSAGGAEAYRAVPHRNRAPAGDEVLAVNAPAPEQPESLSLQTGVFDGGDENFDRFRIKDYEVREEAIIGSRQNVYLPFPMLKMKVSQLDKLMEQSPEYVIHPKETRENKEARLLLTLSERKRDGVFMKTYDYFMNRYPDSQYAEILKSLAGQMHLRRWREGGKAEEFDAAHALYTELVHKYPASPLREHNFLILGFSEMERGDALTTLQTFESFLKTYPNSIEIPVVHKALAEAYLILRKYDEATAEYQAIIKEFPKTPFAHEAHYRLGDVLFAKRDYSGAVRTYEAAIKELPADEKVYPNADFNMAEARFWQKDFKKSLNNYIQFVNLFPAHEYGGYALTRIGELLGVLGADQRRVMGAFLESYFRFPNHPGAQVARIRMLSQQMKGMKPGELKRALQEIHDIGQKLDLPEIQEFTTLMVSEGLTHRGEYTQAIADLIAYYQKNPTSENLGSFKSRILRNIANELKDQVDRGEFMKALAFYDQYSSTWLKNSGRIDIPFELGQAYEKAGAYSEAQNIYRDALEKRQEIAGTEAEKEKRVQEHLPSVASLHLRLAATMVQERNYMQAYQQLKAMGSNSELTPTETVERVQLNALIAEQRNDHEHAREALMDLAQKWQGDPALVAPVNMQLAQIFNKMGDHKKAESYADKVMQAETGETPMADKVLAGALTAKADAQIGQKKSMAAVETYQKLLERFEAKLPLGAIRYKVGQILFDRGDLKGAADVWKHLEGTPDELLAKIGKEKLDQSQWQDEYNKYIHRIPAMARGTKEEKP